MSNITVNNLNMKPDEFHRMCQIAIAHIITKDKKLPKQDFETMSTEEIENYNNKWR